MGQRIIPFAGYSLFTGVVLTSERRDGNAKEDCGRLQIGIGVKLCEDRQLCKAQIQLLGSPQRCHHAGCFLSVVINILFHRHSAQFRIHHTRLRMSGTLKRRHAGLQFPVNAADVERDAQLDIGGIGLFRYSS